MICCLPLQKRKVEALLREVERDRVMSYEWNRERLRIRENEGMRGRRKRRGMEKRVKTEGEVRRRNGHVGSRSGVEGVTELWRYSGGAERGMEVLEGSWVGCIRGALGVRECVGGRGMERTEKWGDVEWTGVDVPMWMRESDAF
ncbi:hypothetical protein Tco_0371428 [Tanacetum coccineum]